MDVRRMGPCFSVLCQCYSSFPSSDSQLMVGLGGWGPAQGGTLPSERPICAAAFLAALANTLPSTPQSCQEFRLALGDSGNRRISQEDGATEQVVGAAGWWEDSTFGSSSP